MEACLREMMEAQNIANIDAKTASSVSHKRRETWMSLLNNEHDNRSTSNGPTIGGSNSGYPLRLPNNRSMSSTLVVADIVKIDHMQQEYINLMRNLIYYDSIHNQYHPKTRIKIKIVMKTTKKKRHRIGFSCLIFVDGCCFVLMAASLRVLFCVWKWMWFNYSLECDNSKILF